MKIRIAPVLPLVLFAWMAAGAANALEGDYPDLAVRGMTVAPARAHVGDTIQVKVLLRNLGYAGDPVDTYTATFSWNTSGAAPGEYTLQADFSYDADPTPDDNQLTLKTPLVLVAPGAPFPGGQPAGGTIKYTDPAEKEWWDR